METAMCEICRNEKPAPQACLSRRGLLRFFGAATTGLALAGTAGAKEKTPPKPQNVVSPDASLELLMSGNKRYIGGDSRRHDFKHEREALVGGQNPYAGILSCADSRIAPEYAFDSGRGDLFVVRVAGNFAEEDGIASLEYTVKFLGTPLLMVLGHEKCGAVDAAIKTVKDGAELPGHLPHLVEHIRPAVKTAMSEPGDLLANAIRENVLLNVESLKTASPILSQYVEDKKVRVVGGIYKLADSRIE